MKNNLSIHQSFFEGSYEVSEKINGKPTWVTHSSAIWYSQQQWVIGDLSDIGGNSGGIFAYEKGGFSCPYEATIDVIEFYNPHTDTIDPDISKYITIQCTTPLQGDEKNIFESNLQNYKPEKNVVLCIIAYVITEDPFQVKQGFVGRK